MSTQNRFSVALLILLGLVTMDRSSLAQNSRNHRPIFLAISAFQNAKSIKCSWVQIRVTDLRGGIELGPATPMNDQHSVLPPPLVCVYSYSVPVGAPINIEAVYPGFISHPASDSSPTVLQLRQEAQTAGKTLPINWSNPTIVKPITPATTLGEVGALRVLEMTPDKAHSSASSSHYDSFVGLWREISSGYQCPRRIRILKRGDSYPVHFFVGCEDSKFNSDIDAVGTRTGNSLHLNVFGAGDIVYTDATLYAAGGQFEKP